jgi:diguanylate cyclase (GGDEF)-like protein
MPVGVSFEPAMKARIQERLRQDGLLLGGIALALLVALVRPFGAIFEMARTVETEYDLALLPALVVLLAVFFFHQWRKRHEAGARAHAADGSARAAIERADDLEHLFGFGRAVSGALDLPALRAVLAEHLPALALGRETWVVVRRNEGWEWLADTRAVRDAHDRRASEALSELATGAAPTGPAVASRDGHLCFPLVAAGEPLGVLGVLEGPTPLGDSRRGMLAAATALVAIGVQNVELVRQIREASRRDGLTGCFNRTHAIEVVDYELHRSARSAAPLSVILFDLDHFKAINDRFGHLAGDAVLASVGSLLRSSLRSTDTKCRYGGEEFLVLLAGVAATTAAVVAESLRRAIAGTPVVYGGVTVHCTASLGVAEAAPGEVDSAAFVARADEALYAAKRAGRNRVRLAPTPLPASQPSPVSFRAAVQARQTVSPEGGAAR